VVVYITFLTALCTLVAAVAGIFRTHVNSKKITETSRQVTEVHMAVNSRLDSALLRIEQLGDTLRAAGVKVPAAVEKETGNAATNVGTTGHVGIGPSGNVPPE
jgi:hypothetical protein